MQILTMTKGASRWGSSCSYCNGRVRMGRTYVVDPEDGAKVLHDGCFALRGRRAAKPMTRVER